MTGSHIPLGQYSPCTWFVKFLFIRTSTKIVTLNCLSVRTTYSKTSLHKANVIDRHQNDQCFDQAGERVVVRKEDGGASDRLSGQLFLRIFLSPPVKNNYLI